jgi:hypothetical protein
MTIRESIESAFRDVPYPGDDNITRCTHADCLECAEVAEHFRGMTWHGHTMQSLWRVRDTIPLLTPEALHYFLPAFMLAILDTPQDADITPISIIGQFTPPAQSADERQRAYFDTRLAQFTPAQRQAIADFLREIARVDPDETGIPKAVQILIGHETAA